LKKIFLILLLFAFLLKPIYNVCYFVYYQNNIDYITATYCKNKKQVKLSCNGKCHLAKQLQSETSSNENNKPAKVFTEYISLVYFQKCSNFDVFTTTFYLKKKISKFYNQSYNYAFEYKCFRPPSA